MNANNAFIMTIVALGFYGIGFQSPVLCFCAGALMFGNAIALYLWAQND